MDPIQYSRYYCENDWEIYEAMIPHLDAKTVMTGKLNTLNKITWTRALLAPIRRLPAEILSEIFIHCVPCAAWVPYDGRNMVGMTPLFLLTTTQAAPIILMHVCRQWRRVALDTPRLFTQFILGESPENNP